ncbi:SnoaL-like domain-containing protein [Sphingobium faniae]|nr:SnoaL-like domain-containing protein [Sphingobium faniae]
MATIEQRVQRLEDIQEIIRLKSLYNLYANMGEANSDAEAFAALFVEDCQWDLSGNMITSRDGIIARLKEIEGLHYVGVHMSVNPRIDVEPGADEAYGEWELIFPVHPPGGKPMTTVCGYYWDHFRRTPEGWRFSSVRYRASPNFAIR